VAATVVAVAAEVAVAVAAVAAVAVVDTPPYCLVRRLFNTTGVD